MKWANVQIPLGLKNDIDILFSMRRYTKLIFKFSSIEQCISTTVVEMSPYLLYRIKNLRNGFTL